ncbi:MAG: hypothetical protein MRY74_13945 [Neomegalonema sp.]|nr:hypothetical protein [Neomegalonema sp.]
MAWGIGLLTLICAAMWGDRSAAQATLVGREVSVRVLTYNDPTKPLFDGRTHLVRVGAGVEFRLGREGLQNGLDVVPVTFDISRARIEAVYPAGLSGGFYPAKFNGYIFEFKTECALFREARIDRAFTTLDLEDADVYVRGGRLYVNTARTASWTGKRFAIDVKVAPCRIN